jgi:hypothetical protein
MSAPASRFPFPVSAMPPADSRADAPSLRTRQKRMLALAIGMLLLCAVALVALPLHRVPFFVRAYLAAFDTIVAIVLWVVGRQKLAGR